MAIPCEPDPFLLRIFPGPWLNTCDLFYNDHTRILTNISLIDASTHIIDNDDQTKRFRFEADGITTGTTRVLTIPDADLTIVGEDTAQTLTNKNITGSSNTIGATQLETSGIPVLITSSAPTGAGQALVTTSTGTATWQTISSGGSGLATYSLVPHIVRAVDTDYISVSSFPWLQSRYGTYTGGVVVFRVNISGNMLDVRLRNETTSTDLGSLTGIVASGTMSFPVSMPTADANVVLQIRKMIAGGSHPTIDGVVLEFTT